MGSVFQRATTTCRTCGTTTQHAIISHYFPWAREGISGGPFIYFTGSSKKIWLHHVRWNIVHGRFDEKTVVKKIKKQYFGKRRLKPLAFDEYLPRLKLQEKKNCWTWLILHFNTWWRFSAARWTSLFQRGVSVLSRREPFTEQFYKIATCISFRARNAPSRVVGSCF